jgi:hypothetical protein
MRLSTFPTVNFWQYYFYYPYVRRMSVLRPLNYLPYSRDEAIATLERELGYRYYNTKHGESRFTKFFQNHYQPTRFRFDKRRAHVASLIQSGQLTREQALEELAKPLYDPRELREDEEFFVKKLGLTRSEFAELMATPVRSWEEFPSNRWLMNLKDRAKPALKALGIQPKTK